MLYKILALLSEPLLSGDGEIVENVGQTGIAGRGVMLFMVTRAVALESGVSIYVKKVASSLKTSLCIPLKSL